MNFGDSRLLRDDVGMMRRLHYRLFGLADPGHYLRSNYFKRFSSDIHPTQVLDAGCGGGDYSFYMASCWPQARIHSIDLSASEVSRNAALQKKIPFQHIQFEQMDLTKLKDTNTYDLIVCIDVLEHIRDQQLVLKVFADALKKGGHVYLHIPLKRETAVPLKKYLADFDKWAEHEHVGEERTKEQMLLMIEEAGFEVVKSQNTFCYYFGEMANSIYFIFLRKSLLHSVLQAILSPFLKLLCVIEMMKIRDNGFALAVLARKK